MNNSNGFARIPTVFIALVAVAASGGMYYAVQQSRPFIEETADLQPTSTVTNGNEPVTGQACRDIVNATFSSVREYGCGMVPAGSPPIKCHYELKFSAQGFEWGHDDMVEQGSYTCRDGAISATSRNPERAIPVQYNSDAKILKWENEEYRRL